MNKWTVVLLLGVCCFRCSGRMPFRPREGSMPFLVYYPSRYRGICAGVLAARTVVLTAAVCVTSPIAKHVDRRSINVVTGTAYRHPVRGIRVQVTQILIPNLKEYSVETRGILMIKSTAILMLKQSVPDVLVEIPLRPISIDWRGDENLMMHQACMIPGWHFFNRGDKIYPVHKFLLQRHLRAQVMNIVKKDPWCEALVIKFTAALNSLGYSSLVDEASGICLRDIEQTAQPCHGMYGAPMIVHGQAVGMLLAPDAQWTNCTGFSNMVHVLSSKYLKRFMTCASRMFNDEDIDWKNLETSVYEDPTTEYDYIPEMYDKLYKDTDSSSSSDEL